MSSRFFVLLSICMVLLSGCQTQYTEKLNTMRDAVLPNLYNEIIAADLEFGAPAFMRIFKDEGELEVWLKDKSARSYKFFKTYPICTYSGFLGPKFAEGDKQAPEGFYNITKDRLWPGSKYHLAMNVGFPNKYDQHHGRYGSNIMIHGDCVSEGCYAMTDDVIEEIYIITEQAIRNGQRKVPVHIFPFRMTRENMANWMNEPWTPFWLNLKQGYDLFEINHIPPKTAVKRGKYVFPDFYVPRGLKLDRNF